VLLAICQRLLWDHRGCTTPFEDLIYSLLITAELRAPEPEDVNTSIEEYRENWDDAVSDARAFLLDYPHIVREEEEA
jgi:hypothetical protein